MKKTKKTLAILAIVVMVFTMIPMQLFAANATTYDHIDGITQYDTAAKIAAAGWPNGAETAIIAVGTVGNSYDALAAGPLAVKKNAPILLTESNRLTTVTQSALQSLGVKNVIIIGGVGVIKQGVEDAIKALGISTSRLYGADAAETSVKVAQEVGASSAIVLAGGKGQDALSVASIAAAKGYPILYTNKATNLPDAVANYVSGLSGINTSYVIGGTAVISAAEAAQLPGTVVRYSGNDAYDTNLAVIRGLADSIDFSKVYAANGETMVDALAGAPLAAKSNSAIVLTDDVKIPAASFVSSKLSADSKVLALGGGAVVSPFQLQQIGVSVPTITVAEGADAKTLTVTFSKAVDDTKAVFVVTKGVTTVAQTAAFNVDKTVATLTFTNVLAAGDYSVSVTGLSAEAITAACTVTAPIEHEYTLTAGNYFAGVDIPTGVCNVVAVSGTGNLISSNLDSGGVNEMFGVDDGSGLYIDSFNNLKLPEGTMLSTNNRLTVTLTYTKITSNFTGRMYDEASAINLDSGNYTAGEDFPPGIYKIVAVSGQGNLSSSNLLDGGVNEVFGIDNGSDFSGFYNNQFLNAILSQGVELTVSGGLSVKLIPAK